MEFVFEEEVLENYLNKCRCCFRTVLDEQKFVQISPQIERSFFDLTQIKLVEANIFSNKICQLCRNDLDAFSQFRNDMLAKQNALYRLLSEREPEFASSIFNLKNEKNDIIEVNCLNEDENLFQAQVVIKNELDYEIAAIESESGVENQWLTKTIQSFPCNSCEFHASTNKYLRKHIRSVHGLSKLHCDICPYETTDKFSLEEHVELHTSKDPQSYYCEFCSKEFDKRHLLNRHIKLKHTEKERSHSCPTCNKSFYTISTLKKHVESHRAKNMPCEFCGKLFSCMNNLRTHLYYHAEPKFICEFEGCDKKFFMRKLLKAHMNVHRGQKDFACGYCEKSYFFQSHLKRHIISTHMKLKIDCEVVGCSSSFARKETYRNHVINHHQNIGPEDLHNLLTKIRNLKVEEYRCVG